MMGAEVFSGRWLQANAFGENFSGKKYSGESIFRQMDSGEQVGTILTPSTSEGVE